MLTSSLVLMVMSGPDDGQKIVLNQSDNKGQVAADGSWLLTFGRRDECDIAVPFDTQVSRQHAVLRVEPDGTLRLSDAGSLNGTFIGDTRIEAPTVIGRGQLFRLGRTWLRVQPETDEG